MQTPIQIRFTNIDRSEAVETVIRARAERLPKFASGITSCHVYVEDTSHRRKGNRYKVRVEVRVPGAEIAVNAKPGDIRAHDDILVAVRDAFDAMERRLKRRKPNPLAASSGRATPLQGRVAELHAEERFGQIEARDGRLVYFHANSVVNDDFARLGVGDTVELVVQEDESEKGPQASTVRRIGPMKFVDRPD